MQTDLTSPANILLLCLTGIVVGIINGVVGSGSLISFPLMVAMGIPPVAANGSNAVGMVPGAISATWADRHRLKPRKHYLVALFLIAFFSALAGALLVVVLPKELFISVVPWLIWFSVLLVAVQPLLGKLTQSLGVSTGDTKGKFSPAMKLSAIATGAYGGYFGAAQGVLLLAVLGIFDDPDLRRSNGVKNLLTIASTTAASIVFLFTNNVVWVAAIAIGAGSLVGGWIGGKVSQLLPKWVFQILVIAIGISAGIYVGINL